MSRRLLNAAAVERAIKAMDLDREFDGLVALVRSLARAVDADPCGQCKAAQDAAIWREYRQALKALTEAGVAGGDDGNAAFLVSISTPRRTQVGDTSES